MTTASVIHAVTSNESAFSPSIWLESYPPALEQVVMKALEKSSAARWESAEQMRVALEQALPLAFSEAGQLEHVEFMKRVLGDRKLARREALRRAQLAADAFDTASGKGDSSASVASLRAIAITQPPPADLEGISPKPSVSPTRRPEHLRRRRLPRPWLAAALGVSAAVFAIAPRVFERGAPRAAGGVSRGAELSSSASASNAPVPSASGAPSSSPARAR